MYTYHLTTFFGGVMRNELAPFILSGRRCRLQEQDAGISFQPGQPLKNPREIP
jgi:hypothetical protein